MIPCISFLSFLGMPYNFPSLHLSGVYSFSWIQLYSITSMVIIPPPALPPVLEKLIHYFVRACCLFVLELTPRRRWFVVHQMNLHQFQLEEVHDPDGPPASLPKG